MAATPETQAINMANDLLAVMQAHITARDMGDDWLKKYTAQNTSAVWNAMATTAVNADGSLGTADGTVNNAHVIDTRLANQAGLQMPLSANNLVNMAALLQAEDAFYTNAAVATSNRDAILNLARSG